jgi:hypothetical protein
MSTNKITDDRIPKQVVQCKLEGSRDSGRTRKRRTESMK